MRTSVHIKNLESCGCKRIILNSLSKIKNIDDVTINETENTVAFNYHTNHDFETVKHTLSRIGYPIRGKENHLEL